MSDEPAGYDFFYEPEVRALLSSLTDHLDVFFQPAGPLVARVFEIQIRL